ncbi:MAG: molybdopterin-binding protein [Pseudomonadota bacterium]
MENDTSASPSGAPVTAAILVIGDEILSGRTQDTNTHTIANWLAARGVRLRETRTVADDQAAIVAGLNALRAAYDYVFTTGGIGPTHDDITADAVASAVGARLVENAEALRRLEAALGAEKLNLARRRMARAPEGAILIDNPVSAAPGFQIKNVFVLAGVPRIMQAMLDNLDGRIRGGVPITSVTLRSDLREGDIAATLGEIQAAESEVSLGSYPSYGPDGPRVSVVVRGEDAARVEAAASAVKAALSRLGGEAERIA